MSKKGWGRVIHVSSQETCPFRHDDDRSLGPDTCNLRYMEHHDYPGKWSCVGVNDKDCPIHECVIEVRRGTG